jgi:WXG100 family type VII secretion target
MTEIVVKFAALHKASEDINKAISNLTSELDNLEKGVQPLLSTWDGQAREAYYARQREWSSASGDLKQLLLQIKGAVDKSAEIMQARESANMKKFGG